MLTDDDLERIVMTVFSKLEFAGLIIGRDCEVTLARAVAVKMRRIYEQKDSID